MNIRIDEKNLTVASVMPLFEAAQKIADLTGELVTIEAYDGIKFSPAPVAATKIEAAPYSVHTWPALDGRAQEGLLYGQPSTDSICDAVMPAEKVRTDKLSGGPAVKDSLTVDPFAVDWSKAAPEAKGALFMNGEFQGWTKYTEDHYRHLKDYLYIKRPVPCTITTSSLLKDQAS